MNPEASWNSSDVGGGNEDVALRLGRSQLGGNNLGR